MTSQTFSDIDHHWMRCALGLARRGLGRVAPNPAVGCILIKDGIPVGRGWTQPTGRPHAETEALARAGQLAKGSTAYVTLEPCSHTGQTGPCAVALINAGVARVVIAIEDPDPRVSGRGIKMLEEAGIQTDVGLCRDAALDLNAGFLSHRLTQRPFVTLKLATSLDGRIATARGESKWITGPDARADAHLLRAQHDAILVGVGTALADDPSLTVRLPGHRIQPLRVVLDGKGRLPVDAKLCDESAKTLQIVDAMERLPAPPARLDRVAAPRAGQGLGIDKVLEILAEKGITRVMVEGGGQVAASFLNADVVERIVWYRAGLVLGATGRPAMGEIVLENLADFPRWEPVQRRRIGPDFVDEWRRRR